MGIILITPYLPYENVCHAGGKFVYDFIKKLQEQGEKVYLISVVVSQEIPHLESAKNVCSDAVFIIRDTFPGKILGYFKKHPIDCMYRLARRIIFERARISREISGHIHSFASRYDVNIVQVEYSEMRRYIRNVDAGRLKILSLHDVMIKPARRVYQAQKNIFRKAFEYLRFKTLERSEISFCQKFDILLVKSDHDGKILREYGDFRIETLSLGVEIHENIPSFKEREKSVLFVGAMYRKFNENAAMYFIENVMPSLKEKVKGVKFYVVGDAPSTALKGFSSGDVIVTGRVDDLTDFYNRCRVMAVPLFYGGGIIFKVIQSMGAGLPVVSTDIANEGVGAGDGAEILIANTPEQFLRQVSLLLEDEGLWNGISAKGRSFVEERYSWDRIMEKYALACRSAVSERGRRS